jgi:hypothetical protein
MSTTPTAGCLAGVTISPSPTPGRPRFVLTLEALPDVARVAVRLRNLLKTALRRDRLKCISATTAGPENATPHPDEEIARETSPAKMDTPRRRS